MSDKLLVIGGVVYAGSRPALVVGGVVYDGKAQTLPPPSPLPTATTKPPKANKQS